MSTWNPKRRYSAVAVLSEDLDRVVLIHKLRPDWQARKANLPGGKVEAEKDYIDGDTWEGTYEEACDLVYRRCASRELREETGLDVATTALTLFCRLRFKSREGDDAECCFYVVVGDVQAAKTMETEQVFWDHVDGVCTGVAEYFSEAAKEDADKWISLPTMPNLPYLVAMARQCLRSIDAGTWPLTVYENGATP